MPPSAVAGRWPLISTSPACTTTARFDLNGHLAPKRSNSAKAHSAWSLGAKMVILPSGFVFWRDRQRGFCIGVAGDLVRRIDALLTLIDDTGRVPQLFVRRFLHYQSSDLAIRHNPRNASAFLYRSPSKWSRPCLTDSGAPSAYDRWRGGYAPAPAHLPSLPAPCWLIGTLNGDIGPASIASLLARSSAGNRSGSSEAPGVSEINYT